MGPSMGLLPKNLRKGFLQHENHRLRWCPLNRFERREWENSISGGECHVCDIHVYLSEEKTGAVSTFIALLAGRIWFSFYWGKGTASTFKHVLWGALSLDLW